MKKVIPLILLALVCSTSIFAESRVILEKDAQIFLGSFGMGELIANINCKFNDNGFVTVSKSTSVAYGQPSGYPTSWPATYFKLYVVSKDKLKEIAENIRNADGSEFLDVKEEYKTSFKSHKTYLAYIYPQEVSTLDEDDMLEREDENTLYHKKVVLKKTEDGSTKFNSSKESINLVKLMDLQCNWWMF